MVPDGELQASVRKGHMGGGGDLDVKLGGRGKSDAGYICYIKQ